MKFSKKIVIFCISTVIIYTIAVLVLMFSTGCSEPTTLTENVFTYFGIEAFALALIKVADTVKEATDKFEPSKKKKEMIKCRILFCHRTHSFCSTL